MTSRRRAFPLLAPRRDEHGLTLLEAVIALSLFALTLGGIYTYVVTGGKSARVTNDFLQTQAQLRAVLDNIVDEIRWAQSVTAASATSVTLLVPQGSPFASPGPYTVTFAYNAAADTATRRVDPDAGGPLPPGPAEPVAYGVVKDDGSNGLAFGYFNAEGTWLGTAPADLSAIARVRLTVTTTRRQISRTFTSDAALRAR
jgi:hypothetical protein